MLTTDHTSRVAPVVLLSLLVTSFTDTSLLADDWLGFRGPLGQGHAESLTAPIEFSADSHLRWQQPIEGRGWSSPVVKDGQCWFTTAVPKVASAAEQARRLAGDPMAGIKEVAKSVELRAVCLDFETGRVLHDVSLGSFDSPPPINPLNSFASPTPAIAGDRIVCHFGTYGTWCLSLSDGSTIWERQIKIDHSVGPGSSPYIYKHQVILPCDGIDQQFVASLDLQTGEELWRTSRPPMRATEVEYRKAYSSPIVMSVGSSNQVGKDQIIVPGAQWICGYDPQDGNELWRIDHGDGFSTTPVPVVTDAGLVVFATGYMRSELVAVRPDGRGDVTDTHLVWRSSRGAPNMPSPLAVGNRVYMISDNGILTQVDASNGNVLWKERLGGNFSSSPILVGDKLYLCSREGVVTVVQDADQFKPVASNDLGSRIMASPVAIDGDLLLRTEDAVLRIGS